MLKSPIAALLLTCSLSVLAMESQINISNIAGEGRQAHAYYGDIYCSK